LNLSGVILDHIVNVQKVSFYGKAGHQLYNDPSRAKHSLVKVSGKLCLPLQSEKVYTVLIMKTSLKSIVKTAQLSGKQVLNSRLH